MWFTYSVIALLCWSGSDLFSKIGCRNPNAKYSHLKMVMAVGLVMGLHAAYELIFAGTELHLDIVLAYLPVAALYIASMALGYLGLRYIELSISSPICNASGALTALTGFIVFGMRDTPWIMPVAVALVCAGVIGLGVVEHLEDPAARLKRQEKSNYKYAKSFAAIALPLAYCVLDTAGTFGDTLVLQRLTEKRCLAAGIAYDMDAPSEAATAISDAVASSANAVYELTFLLCGIICAIYVLGIRRDRLIPRQEGPKLLGAAFETAGQFAYIFALSDTAHAMYSAPIISSYCVLSVIWSRVFLKERLSAKHYAMVVITIIGIVLLGIFDA